MGHANVAITLTIYAHVIPRPRRGSSDRLAAILKDTPIVVRSPAPPMSLGTRGILAGRDRAHQNGNIGLSRDPRACGRVDRK
jgi:hypothetical protein